MVVLVFWLISDIAGLFHGMNEGGVFINVLIVFSIVGSYAGAGIVGWRIADKYHHKSMRRILNVSGEVRVENVDATQDVGISTFLFRGDTFPIKFNTLSVQNDALNLGAAEINADAKHSSTA